MKKIFKLKLFICTFMFFIIFSEYKVQANENEFYLNFTVTDAVMHPTKPVLYITSKDEKKLYEVNYETQEVKEIVFDLPPERLTLANNEIYVCLLKEEHNSEVGTKEQEGAIAIVDAEKLEKIEQFEIDTSPYDIVVDKERYIYVSPKRNVHSYYHYIKSYDRNTLEEISKQEIDAESNIELHPQFNKIYSTNKYTVPRDMDVYFINNGKIEVTYDMYYHGDYDLNTNFKISPDGKYIFNGIGNVFECSNIVSKDSDMKFLYSLKTEFTDIDFNIDNNRFYTAKDNKIIQYNYENFEPIAEYISSEVVKKLFYHNNKLIILTEKNKINIINDEAFREIEPIDYNGIKLNGTISDIIYDKDNNKAYAVDKVFNNMFIIDLNEKKIEKSVKLPYTPSSLCMSIDKESIFIVNEDENYLISEFNLTDLTIKRNLQDRTPYPLKSYSQRHIYSGTDRLYVVLDTWSFPLLMFDNETFEKIEYEPLIWNVGDFSISKDNKYLYYWFQNGFDSRPLVYKYSIDEKKLTIVGKSDLSGLDSYNYPNDMPIILLEDKGLMIFKKFIINIENLEDIKGSFPEVIYAVDPSNKYAVGKEGIYNLNTLEKVCYVDLRGAQKIFFDNNGILNYLKDNILYSFNYDIDKALLMDINNDGFIDAIDFYIILYNYGNRNGETTYNEIYDMNKDGIIDIYDLSIMGKEMKVN